MKKSINTIILAAAAIFAAMSCQKEETDPGAQKQVKTGETIQVSINANLNDLESGENVKATAKSVIRLEWASGDKVQAYCGTEKISTGDGLTVTPSENGMFASLTGEITAPETGSTITFVYSSGCVADGLTFDFSSQDANIPFVAYGTLEYDGKAITNKMVGFKFATSVMKIAATNLAGGAISNVTISGINTKVTLTPKQDSETCLIAGGENANITKTAGIDASSDGTMAIITVGLVPDNTQSPNRKLSVAQQYTKTAALTSAIISENKSYVTPCALDFDYVVIGGKKWATMNLGATTVAGSYATCAGDYYQWGSVNTLYESVTWSGTSVSVNWKSDKSSGFVRGNQEYNTNADLPDRNDVVKQELGYGWRMPTSTDFKDLADACGGSYNTSKKPGKDTPVEQGIYWCDDYDGVAGCLFCDGTNKLFFPATGRGNGNAIANAGDGGHYWSSTFHQTDITRAHYLYFNTTTLTPQDNYDRCWGRSVRPVKD